MDYSDTFPRQFPSESSTNPPGSTRCLEPPSRWLQGGPALEEIRSTFGHQQQRGRSNPMVRKRKRPIAPTNKETNNTTTVANHTGSSSSSGSDEGYNGSVSENERSTESSSSDDDDDDDMLRPPSHEKRNATNANAPRLLLRKRSLVPPYSEIDDFGSEYCSDDGVFFSSSSEEEEEEEDSKPPARYIPRRAATAHHNSKANPDAASILAIGGDVMAHVLTFLEPPNILQVLTAPLCRTWTLHFTRNTEVWRVLCLTDPFKATNVEPDVDFRWLYTSFVRCLRYLVRMTEDSRNGRPLTIPGQQQSHPQQENYLIASNRNLHRFFSRARAATQVVAPPTLLALSTTTATAAAAAANPSSPSSGKRRRKKRKEKTAMTTEKAATSTTPPVRYGRSSLTQNLLGPTARGVVGQVELPWSCAMYSIVNWMVGFRNVEGIQTMCLKALPILLEDEQQRTTARQAGLTELVLRSMVAFPDSVQLHAAAFHTIVLLARPMGGREGMLFHSTLVDSNGIFSSPEVGAADGKSGMAVLLDSMRRFLPDQTLQAMGCWSMVNIALVPAQKNVLIKLGAIDVALQAMVQHAASEEVQFRALFALINLIIPAEDVGEAGAAAPTGDEAAAASNNVYDDVDADRIVDLVVTSMQTFYSHNAILNRACLVLHNLSLNTSFHSAMLWSPRCYQMLEWCLTQYRRTDPVLYQGALRTLHRLQLTLSSNEAVRRRFLSVLRTEQQKSLRLVRQEALREADAAAAAAAAAAVVEAAAEGTTTGG